MLETLLLRDIETNTTEPLPPEELGLEDRQGSGLINSWPPGEGGSLPLRLRQHLLPQSWGQTPGRVGHPCRWTDPLPFTLRLWLWVWPWAHVADVIGWPSPRVLLSCPSFWSVVRSWLVLDLEGGKESWASARLTRDLIMKWYFPFISILYVNVPLGKLVGRSGRFFWGGVSGGNRFGWSWVPVILLLL